MFNRKLEQKRSAIDLTELAIGIILIGIVVSIGAYILLTFRNTRTDNLPSYQYAVNESVKAVNETGVTLTGRWVSTIDVVTNASTNTNLPTGNYTVVVNPDFGTSVLKYSSATGATNNSVVNVTYSVRNTSDTQWSIPNNASIGLGEYGNWFKIIVIIGAAALVLALIYMMLGGKDSSSSGLAPY